MRNFIEQHVNFAIFIISWLILPITSVWANEPQNKVSSAPLGNIGFMKNPPKALREKFPMCDAFLKVEWVDKEKKIGYSKYEIILNKNNERKTMWSLVWMDSLWPRTTIDIYRYKKEGRLNELFSFIRRGKLVQNSNRLLLIQDAKSKEYFEPSGTYHFTWGNNQQTVCIAYPDEDWAWIIEGKSVKNRLNETEKATLTEKITKAVGHPFKEEWFNELWLLDINHDGKMDLVRGDSVEYSVGDEYYDNKRIEIKAGWGAWRFPPFNKDCVVNKEDRWDHYLTTDGKNYYIAHECNLTELTSSKDKE